MKCINCGRKMVKIPNDAYVYECMNCGIEAHVVFTPIKNGVKESFKQDCISKHSESTKDKLDLMQVRYWGTKSLSYKMYQELIDNLDYVPFVSYFGITTLVLIYRIDLSKYIHITVDVGESWLTIKTKEPNSIRQTSLPKCTTDSSCGDWADFVSYTINTNVDSWLESQ